MYSAARVALEKCTRIDECKDWADKAEALASYAKQSDDQTMHQMANRIRARAIRRCGQLLREMQPSSKPPGRPKRNGTGAGTISRKQAASDAGLSKRQKDTALRVANVPADDFAAAVESDNPPTVTQLAERGKKPAPKPIMDLQGRNPKDFQISTHFQGHLREFARWSQEDEGSHIDAALRGAFDKDLPRIEQHAMTVAAWVATVIEKVRRSRPL